LGRPAPACHNGKSGETDPEWTGVGRRADLKRLRDLGGFSDEVSGAAKGEAHGGWRKLNSG